MSPVATADPTSPPPADRPAVDDEVVAAIARHVRGTTGKGGEKGPFAAAAASVEADAILLAHAFPASARGAALKPLHALAAGRKAADAWDEIRDLAGDTPAAALIAAELFRSAPKLPPGLAKRLAEELRDAAAAVDDDAPSSPGFTTDPRVLSLAAELPLVLSLTLPEKLAPAGTARSIRTAARNVFRENLEAATDSDGTPHAALFADFPAWLAVLVRATRRADAAGFDLWGKRRRKRLSELVAVATSLLRRDGTAVFTPIAADAPSAAPVLLAAAALGDWKKSHPDGRRLLAVAGVVDRPEPTPLIDPLVSTEWGRVVTLAADDGPRADRVTLAHDRPAVGVEIAFRGHPIVSGPSMMTATVVAEPPPPERNGTARRPPIGSLLREPYGPWDAVCTSGDVDGIYHELANETDGVTFGRQFFLATDDRVLFVVDSALATGPDADRRPVELEVAWPLAGGDPLPASGSAPGVFLTPAGGKKRRVGCYPAHVPQSPREAVARPGNTVLYEEGTLRLRGAGLGVAVCVTAFDGAKGTDATVADWRKLTVAEEGRELPDASAVGYRLRVGRRQWLVTRRFDASKAMRTVLGLHHNHETVVGRVEKDGSVAAYVLVE